ncbi:MAG: NUDIX hydrolase [Propionibacteriaceae bacterium]|nr:NUDIX hydrolase [Propionibacteriaceae bacterium]
MAATNQLQAAGIVCLRQRADLEVLLVHRPRYDDWSLPKGKLEAGESLPACAARETREETGVTARLGPPLDPISYEVAAGEKEVQYWLGSVVSVAAHRPNDEVDKIRWLPIDKALARVSYPEDPGLIKQAAALPETTPLIIVRHGKAVSRSQWAPKADPTRPVNERGHRQAAALVGLFAAYGAARLTSSTSTRCIQTLEPYAKGAKLSIESWAALSEEAAADRPGQAARLVLDIAERTAAGTPTVVCGHRPVLPIMLDALGVHDPTLTTASAVVIHLDANGRPVAVEHHRSVV